MSNIRTETWCGYEIRFVEIDGEWHAILKDICDALGLRTAKTAERLHADMIQRVLIETSEVPSKDIGYKRKQGENKSRWMLVVNEAGIYEALFASRKLEARKFRIWTSTVLQKLRKSIGLEGYEVMRMTESDIQEEIDHILEALFWDEERKMLMRSVTVQGGDVEQVPFDGEL